MKKQPIPKHKNTQTLKLQNASKTVNPQYRYIMEKLKFIKNQKNTYKPIQRLGLCRISKRYRGIKKYTVRYTFEVGAISKFRPVARSPEQHFFDKTGQIPNYGELLKSGFQGSSSTIYEIGCKNRGTILVLTDSCTSKGRAKRLNMACNVPSECLNRGGQSETQPTICFVQKLYTLQKEMPLTLPPCFDNILVKTTAKDKKKLPIA